MIAPGATIGVLGGGQLGRMLAIAAAQMGYRVHVLCPEEDPPAGDVAASVTRADYEDADAMARFAAAVDIVTYEFENVPADAVEALAARVPVRPNPRVLAVAQDRVAEKDFVARLGGATPLYRSVTLPDELARAVAAIGVPSIMKTRRMGYDGKGQVRLDAPGEAGEAWAKLRLKPVILERRIDFDAEFSILLARGEDGAVAVYDAPANTHQGGILYRSELPAGEAVAPHLPAARELARAVADALDYVGLLTVEFFATPAGPLFNEMAPRVHNSGHWTIEGARVSQFENHVRAICGLPLGSTERTADRVTMQNLLGEGVHDWPQLLADPRAHLHLYGKSTVQPGRKMGHVTWL